MSFTITFDYRFDTDGFFDSSARRRALEAAADHWEGVIWDDFDPVPAGSTFTVTDPQENRQRTIRLEEEVDDLIVFVGGSDTPFGITSPFVRGVAGPSGFDLAGDIFQSRISSDFRGQGPTTDYEPWAGVISFKDGVAWDASPGGTLEAVAAHELAHILGIPSPTFRANLSNGLFTGPNVRAEVDRFGVEIDPDEAHIDDVRPSILNQAVESGEIPELLEFAILADIGYEIEYGRRDLEKVGEAFALATNAGETIFGTDLADRIDGLAGDDQIQGGGGDDILIGGRGDDILFGQVGNDTAVFAGDRADYSLTVFGTQVSVVRGRERDTTVSVEALEFDDTVVFLDERGLTDREAREVAYLYEAGLNRNGGIDFEGLNFWVDAREQGLDVLEVSQSFLDSAEFASVNGAPGTLSNRSLVESLYRNVLDRDGESAGVEFWMGEVAQADFSRAQLLYAFAISEENVDGSPDVRSLDEVEPGIWDFADL